MTDSNPTRVRYAQNKEAFADVLGDPYAVPESIEGYYNTLQARSLIKTASNSFDESHGTPNAARPNAIDFMVDVENAINSVIKDDKNTLHKFQRTYIYQYIDGESELMPSERADLEQRIGRRFLARGISPVARYFTARRRKT